LEIVIEIVRWGVETLFTFHIYSFGGKFFGPHKYLYSFQGDDVQVRQEDDMRYMDDGRAFSTHWGQSGGG
jgi:hypothetical protein